MYILLIFWILQGPINNIYGKPKDNRPTVQSIEFTTMQACQEAITAISKGNIPGERYYLCLKR